MAELQPAALELMDAAAVAAVEAVRPMGLSGVGALLLAQCDAGTADAQAIERCFRVAGAIEVAASDDPDEAELLMGARRMAIPCVERLGTVLIEDVGVPIPRVPELVAAVADVARRNNTAVPVIGHAGDGNFHPLVTFDPTDPDATERARFVFDEIMRIALGLGGTITGEHGVGILKATHLADQLGDGVMDLNSRVKAALDPAGILNPESSTRGPGSEAASVISGSGRRSPPCCASSSWGSVPTVSRQHRFVRREPGCRG